MSAPTVAGKSDARFVILLYRDGRGFQQHPGKPSDHLDRGHRPVGTMLDAFKAQAAAEMRVPAIVDDAILPDMD